MENFLITISFLGIGMALRRIPAFPKNCGDVLNLFVIYISLPALVLLKIPALTFSTNLVVPALMPWAMLVFSALLILVGAQVFKWKRATTGCLLLLIPLGNTSFLGLPMVKAFFGEEGIPYALIYDQLGTFLALATYGSFILGIYGAGNEKLSAVAIIKKVVLFPPFISLVAAVVLRACSYPDVIVNLLEILASTLVPLVMIAVGFQLTLRLSREVVVPLSFGLVVKLIVAPVVALLFCNIGGLEGVTVQVSIFEAGMPPMISAGALAILAGLSPKLAAASVGLGMMISFATLPVVYRLLF